MELSPDDLHFEFSRSERRLSVWSASHRKVFACEARNRTVAEGQFGHYGNIPDGEFLLGRPRLKNTVPFGKYFIPVVDYQSHHRLRDFKREGIGLHGGGSGLPDPFAARQGWQITEGCVRLQNVDLKEVVSLVKAAQKAGGQCYLTATGAQS